MILLKKAALPGLGKVRIEKNNDRPILDKTENWGEQMKVKLQEKEKCTHYWVYRKYRPDRYHQPCRVLARSQGKGPRNVLVEFMDGEKVVGLRFCVRRLKGQE